MCVGRVYYYVAHPSVDKTVCLVGRGRLHDSFDQATHVLRGASLKPLDLRHP